MTRGQRDGTVTKAVLLERLKHVASQGAVVPPHSTSISEILGHCIFYDLVNKKERSETIPRIERTLACYLQPRLQHLPAGMPERLESYVLIASELFYRGTLIANLLAQALCGERLRSEALPRYNAAAAAQQAAPLQHLFLNGDVRNGPIKQVFLPERWPSAGVPRDPRIAAVLSANAILLPPLPDWKSVMATSGWDNAINRMATKLAGNFQVHACTGLWDRLKTYALAVPLEPGTQRNTFMDILAASPCERELLRGTITDADYQMAVELSDSVRGPDDVYPPSTSPWNQASLALHVFLVRHGARERSFLPVASRGRKYCYLDAKIATALMKASQLKRPRAGVKRRREEPGEPGEPGNTENQSTASSVAPEDKSASVCIGDILGLTPEKVKDASRTIRSQARRQLRARRHAPGLSKKQRERLKRRVRCLGLLRMHNDDRVDSIETDGVGMRMCVKRPVDLSRFVRPLPTAEELAARKAASAAAARKRSADKKRVLKEKLTGVDPSAAPCASVSSVAAPVFVGADDGRKKLYVAAVSRDATKKPTTVVFTRSRYYHEMRYQSHQAWNRQRQLQPALQAALAALSEAGGLRNCDPDLWRATLAAEREHDLVLRQEYLESKEHAVWRMRLFRRKRASLDRAAWRMVGEPVRDEVLERPLVVGVGSAKFSSTGRGELPAPTSALRQALRRAISEVRSRGREVVYLDVWEHRTTLCCCACGSATRAAAVVQPNRTVEEEGNRRRKVGGGSRRLRLCTECDPGGKLRDRDVQAARNMLWLTQHEYYGAPRPQYLCKQPRAAAG